MRYSLLYRDAENVSSSADIDSVRLAIYDLNIDRSVRAFCKNASEAERFLSVLSEPLTCVNDINYRVGILRDLLLFPKLLEGLSSVLKGYDSLRSETEEMAGKIFRYGSADSAAATLDCAYERVYIYAHFFRNVAAYISELDALLSEYDVKSEGLNAIKSFCNEVANDPSIAEAEACAEKFRNETAEGYRFTLSISSDSLLRMNRAELISLEQRKKEKFDPIAVFKRKKKEEIPSSVEIGSSAADNIDTALSYALETLADSFEVLANELYMRLFGMSDELKFFGAASDIEKALNAAELPICYPTVLDAECNLLNTVGICDILLINEGKNRRSIVSNDISLATDKDGILVRGDNNCGKTSFLRSIGTAQLFAQAGLFVCAEEFEASVRYGIFSHFSSAEKEFTDNDAAGRFEGEVKDIAEMLGRLKKYSLVLLNETFQTTAYKEGADGMKLILDALPLTKTKYIFVTHMLSVFKLFEGSGANNAITLKTGENENKYKLIPFKFA